MTLEANEMDATGRALSQAEIEALLFSAAMSFDTAEERARFLAFACRGKPDLHASILRLTAACSAADEFFEFESQVAPLEHPAELSAENDGLGVDVGPYRLIERLGSGGCGVVYLAQQEKPVRRKVALKIIRIGLESPEAIARFELERQALASMNHPNIARVLDAGTNASGRPFFVMELVDGENITDYCDARKLELNERLHLFMQVCHAIQHAHHKGVVHRDIKPSNVLVETHEAMPVPKIIDFGIAQEDGRTRADFPRATTQGLVGSPVFMSPEQVDGWEAVDTRSDIYSLGMLLAELLVGPQRHLPTDLMERPHEEICQILKECRPLLPSQSLAELSLTQQEKIARQRGIRVATLKKILRTELDHLVAKAIHVDPSQRYDTATVLAADVLRWLQGEPLSCHPPTRGYRLAKLMGRNRFIFASAALAFLGLLGGFSVATVLFLREKEARAAETRLRAQAQAAHQAEIVARQRAAYQSRVAESAVRLRYGDFDGAEKLIAPIPADETPASLEAMSVYKTLADWHRVHGRIEAAEIRFLGMIHALARIDRSHTDANSDLFLPAGAMLSSSARPERYAKLRQFALDLYADTQDRLIAERILKVCLLKPLPADKLERLSKLVSILEGSELRQPQEPVLGWESLSIALYYYRIADYDRAERWAKRSIDCPAHADRSLLTSRTLMSLIEKKRGNETKAREFLLGVTADHRLRSESVLDKYESESLWYDTSILRTMLDEAGWKERSVPEDKKSS
ncbi:MAG: hypothetical protein RL117_1506 [Verrucomicrobiota bacterium]|jgi:serine/threonine protein kinase